MGIVLPAEGDALAIKSQQPVIADGNAVCIPAEIAEHLSRSTESRFRVNHPVLSEYGAQKSGEPLRLL